MKTLIKEQEKLERRFIRLIMKLPPEQVLGVSTILGVKLVEEPKEESKIEEKDTIEAIAADSNEKSQEDNEDIPTFVNPILKEDLEVKEDNEKSNEDNESKEDNARDAMTILFESLEKFKALNLQQKKSLIKIMKAGV